MPGQVRGKKRNSVTGQGEYEDYSESVSATRTVRIRPATCSGLSISRQRNAPNAPRNAPSQVGSGPISRQRNAPSRLVQG